MSERSEQPLFPADFPDSPEKFRAAENSGEQEKTIREKKRLRSRIRARRSSLLAEGGRALASSYSDVLESLPDSAEVLAFLPLGAEPPILDGLERLVRRGARVLLPRCLPDRRMEWVRWGPDTPLVQSSIAPVLEPIGEALEPSPEALVLVPALAVSGEGIRLGQGGGFYDAFLASRPAGSLQVAVVYDDELGLPAIPAEPWDARLSRALTQSGLWLLSSPQGEISPDSESACPQAAGWRRVEAF